MAEVVDARSSQDVGSSSGGSSGVCGGVDAVVYCDTSNVVLLALHVEDDRFVLFVYATTTKHSRQSFALSHISDQLIEVSPSIQVYISSPGCMEDSCIPQGSRF